MTQKAFWYSLMTGALFLWVIAIIAGRYLFPGSGLYQWAPFLFLVILHGGEIPFVMKLLRDKNVAPSIVIIKTFMFGFTWWLPFRKGIING